MGCQTQKGMLLRDGDLEVQRQSGEVLHIILPTPSGIVQCLPAKTRLLGPEQQWQEAATPAQSQNPCRTQAATSITAHPFPGMETTATLKLFLPYRF